MMAYDRVFGGDMPDPYYWQRRKNTVVVAVTCTVPDEKCFCLSWDDCGPTMEDKGYDLLLTDIGGSYLVEIGSLEGSLLVQHGFFAKASPDERKSKEDTVQKSRSKIGNLIPDGHRLPGFLESNYSSPVWDEEARKCLSCGTCTLVCPTCFCYHVEDFNFWNVNDGERTRMWDSCQLIDFAEVAMGENFRKDRGARLKWRIYHKLAHWMEQFGTLGCTGCGRCMSYCVAGIDMTRAIAAIREATVNA
jgi:ferredoxin